MKNRIVYTAFLCLIIIVFGVGCDFIAPESSKAITERQQLEVQKELLQVEKQQLNEMKRIADALERMN